MGNIHGIRITTTTTSKLALVECTSIDTAMSLKASFNHLELVPGNILYVAFAKVDDVQNIGQQRVQPQHSQQLPSPAQPLPQLQQQQQQQQQCRYHNYLPITIRIITTTTTITTTNSHNLCNTAYRISRKT